MGRDTAELILEFTKSAPKRLARLRELHAAFNTTPSPDTALRLRLAVQQIRSVGEAFGFRGVQGNATVIESMLKPFVDGGQANPALIHSIEVAYKSFDNIIATAIPQRFEALGLGEITIEALGSKRPAPQ